MSFFNEPKNAGFAMVIVGILNVILAIVLIALSAIDDPILWGTIIAGIGYLIGGFLYYKYGMNIREGAISQKIDILAEFVKVVGIVYIINGIFTLPSDIGTGVLNIILGLIILFMAKKINDGRQTTIDKIIWIILMVVFVINLLVAIVMLIAFPVGTIMGICWLVICVFMIMLLIDNDVKKEMGM